MTPRQPSVPNLMFVIDSSCGLRAMSLALTGSLVVFWKNAEDPIFVARPIAHTSRLVARSGFLRQLRQLLVVQVLHNFSDILRALARRDEQRILGLDHHHVVYSDRRHEFSRSMNIVPARVQNKAAHARNHIAILGDLLRRVMLMQRGPRS